MEESKQIDTIIKNQIEYIQKVRKQTQDAIKSSAGVVNEYLDAEESYRKNIEAKKFAHLGNENFVNRGAKKTGPFMVRRRKSQAEAPNINEAILNSYANKMLT